MSTHDYVIDNQSAPSFRADLNNALSAIVTQNASATAPTVTYADMIWYDTANNQIKKRNEANSAWIILGAVDEVAGTFLPNALATQAQAEAGTNNVTLMTPLRTSQAISILGASFKLLGTINTTSGTTQTLSGLTLTSYSMLVLVCNNVKQTNSGGFSVGSTPFFGGGGLSGYLINGFIFIDLATGFAGSGLALSGTASISSGITNSSTSVSVSQTGTFSGGSIRVYGVK